MLATISDKKFGVSSAGSSLIDHYEPDIITAQDYYPFGMISREALPNSGVPYKFGFNGKLNDNDVKGGFGLQQDYGMRIYDGRVGRFLSVDPITRNYPMLTPYQFASNRPIDGIDLDGKEFYKKNISYDVRSGKFSIIVGYNVNIYSTATHVNVNLPDVANNLKEKLNSAFEGANDSRRKISYSAEGEITINKEKAAMNVDINEAVPLGVNSVTGKRIYASGLTVKWSTQENNVSSSVALMDESETCVVRVIDNKEVALTGIHELLHTGKVYHPFDPQNDAEDVDLVHAGSFKSQNGSITQNYTPSNGSDIRLIRSNIMMYPSTTVNGSRVGDALKLDKISPDQAYKFIKSIQDDSGDQYEKNKKSNP